MKKSAHSNALIEPFGMGQLSLVEHALCPLDSRSSLGNPLCHQTEYFYTDQRRNRRRASVRIHCPLGLAPNDELLLWGHVVGFSDTIPTRQLKAKIQRCVLRLYGSGIVAWPGADGIFEKRGRGIYTVRLERGDYFSRKKASRRLSSIHDTALFDNLSAIGFDDRAIVRFTYPHPLLREWADITLAARERHGAAFFKKSPQAYFVDNIRTAVQGRRTAPDWWHALRKQEERLQAERNRRNAASNQRFSSADKFDSEDSVMETMFELFRTAGQENEVALRNARRCQSKQESSS